MADATYVKQVAIGIVAGIAMAGLVAYLRGDVLFGASVGFATAVVVFAALAGQEIEE